MKIIAINTSGKGQVAEFMHSIGEYATKKGITYKYAVGVHPNRKYHDYLIYRFSFSRLLSKVLTRLTGNFDCYFRIATKRLVSYIKKEKPDLVHIHNLHGDYVNLEILIRFLKEAKIPVVFSLYDTWLFTGKCLDYENDECLRWKKVCKKCPQRKKKPFWLFGDASTKNFLRKKALFSDFENATYVASFKWLQMLLPKTILKAKNPYCVYNGIDVIKFHNYILECKKHFYLPENKKIILCYADRWEKDKSIMLVNQLTQIMGKDYVFIALNASKKHFVKEVIVVRKYKNESACMKYLATASMFLNLSVNNLFPKENLYALASGIPLFTFAIGGSPEQMNDYVGRILPNHDPLKIKKEIDNFFYDHPNPENDCLSVASKFSAEKMVEQYFDIYDKILKKKL